MAETTRKEPKLRAFSGMRGMLWLLVPVWIVAVTSSDFCGQTSFPNQTHMIALSLVFALWAAHTDRLQRGSVPLIPGVLLQAAYNLIILAAITVPLCALFDSTMLFYNCGGQPLGNFQGLGHSLQSHSQGLEEYAQEHELTALAGAPKLIGDLPEWFKESKVSISDNGTYLASSARPPGAVLLVPQFKDGKLTWVCNEYPHQYARAKCRVAPGMLVP